MSLNKDIQSLIQHVPWYTVPLRPAMSSRHRCWDQHQHLQVCHSWVALQCRNYWLVPAPISVAKTHLKVGLILVETAWTVATKLDWWTHTTLCDDNKMVPNQLLLFLTYANLMIQWPSNDAVEVACTILQPKKHTCYCYIMLHLFSKISPNGWIATYYIMLHPTLFLPFLQPPNKSYHCFHYFQCLATGSLLARHRSCFGLQRSWITIDGSCIWAEWTNGHWEE